VTHREHHPAPVDGCFGCKVQGIGYDGGTVTHTTRDELGNARTEHRSGRVDVAVRPQSVTTIGGSKWQ
jgi:hypothetical protein